MNKNKGNVVLVVVLVVALVAGVGYFAYRNGLLGGSMSDGFDAGMKQAEQKRNCRNGSMNTGRGGV